LLYVIAVRALYSFTGDNYQRRQPSNILSPGVA